MSSGRHAIGRHRHHEKVPPAQRDRRPRAATILQSFPTFLAAFLLKLVGEPGVAIFAATASLAHDMLAVTMGPSFPTFFKNRL